MKLSFFVFFYTYYAPVFRLPSVVRGMLRVPDIAIPPHKTSSPPFCGWCLVPEKSGCNGVVIEEEAEVIIV